MRRREVLTGAALAAAVALPVPAIATGIRRLSMVTDWPDGPGVLASARRLAQTVAEASQGRVAIEVTPGGTVVRPFETFDAVQAGIADMFHTHIGYFENKTPAFHFFSGVPYGLTADELYAWVRFGGGQALWDEMAGAFGIKPLLCCSTGAQMGGWFVEEISADGDFKGLRYRMAGLGGEVYRRLGATVVLLPGTDIVQALRSGAIGACEWIGPWLDTAMGLHRVARFYYCPAWNEPGAGLALGINRRVWDGLDPSERALIEAAASAEYATSLAEFNANNALAVAQLRAEDAVAFRRFDTAMLKTFATIAAEVVADAGAGDGIARRTYRSYIDFRNSVRGWTELAEGAYLPIRHLG